MGREVRRVPGDWQHPKNASGDYIPLLNRSFAEDDRAWTEGWEKWQQGLCRSYSDPSGWEPVDPEHRGMRFSEYDCSRPDPDDYMPDWPEAQRTHLMMYENTSEGTPISPAFKTPEELARWLTNNGASAFGSLVGTYEGWLSVAQGEVAIGMIVSDGRIVSGVDALAETAVKEEE